MYRLGEGVRRNRVVALRWFILAAWSGDQDADMQVTLLGSELNEARQKRALEKALRWEFDKDLTTLIEHMGSTTELFSDERRGDQEEFDLPRFVKLSKPPLLSTFSNCKKTLFPEPRRDHTNLRF